MEAVLVAERGGADSGPAVDALDTLLRDGPYGIRSTNWAHANIVVANLLEEQGDLPRALEAIRRRHYNWIFPYGSSYLREEGRLAALTGDSEGAIRAYRHYLELRSDPEPALQPAVAKVRDELAQLVGEEWQ